MIIDYVGGKMEASKWKVWKDYGKKEEHSFS
jgi:hypothetical protein